MANKLRAQIERLMGDKSTLEQQVGLLNTQIETLEDNHKTELSLKDKEWEVKLNTYSVKSQTEISERDERIEKLEEDNEKKQAQIDKRELKKLAEAYREQEDNYKKEADVWLIRLGYVAGVLLLSAFISIIITHNQPWLESIKYYVIDIVIFSAVWFCGAQYSNATKLRYDYANRKTLAQSFSNILNNLAENLEIREKFIEKTTDVLCSPSSVGDKEPLLSKKVIKDVAQIVSVATGK
ncbi:MAG: hypothetical protein WCW56_02990 [Candidatus Paceibacterota bacterium]|jgi:cation transport ATPase